MKPHITFRFDDLADAVACATQHDNMAMLECTTRGGRRVYFATDSGATGADELMKLWGVAVDDPDDEIVGPAKVIARHRFTR